MLNSTKSENKDVKPRFLSVSKMTDSVTLFGGKNKITSTIILICTFAYLQIGTSCFAQCPNGLIYAEITGGGLQTYDPATNISSPTGITVPITGGVAYGPNLNAASPSPTFYSVLGSGNYAYWDGVGWVDTGHSGGPCCISNIASAGAFLYSFDGATGNIWRYDGTGAATVVQTVPIISSTRWDLGTDACGNFYVLNGASMSVYNSNGVLQSSYTVSGLPGTLAKGGVAMVGDKIYATGSTGTADLYVGTISGSTITFAITPKSYGAPGNAPQDMGSCPGTGTGGTCVLPIELLRFTASCVAQNNILCNWNTATETNNDYFTVERSTDAVNFEPVGMIKGAGNSNIIRNYSFTDTHPLPSGGSGWAYYRLKQTDFDGKTETFNSKQVAVDVTECAVQVFPNPAGNTLNVPYVAEQDGEITLEVYDVIGKLVKEKAVTATKGNNKFTLDLSTVAGGVYILSIKAKTNTKHYQKFVKG